MTRKKKLKSAHRRRIPVVLKVLLLCLIAFFALLLLLPEPPMKDGGGVTAVTRRVPALRGTVDPLAETPSSEQPYPRSALDEKTARQVQPDETPEPEPRTQAVPRLAAPPAPRAPVEKQAGQPPVERKVARLPAPTAPPGISALPSSSDIGGWLKSQAWEFLGGVDEQGNILYRFEVWLEAPANVLGAIKQVSYDYDAPSATPKTRRSGKAQGGFRVRFGSLICAHKVTVEVTMADGRSARAVVDGCKALN